MGRGEPAPRPAEFTSPEILPGQKTRYAAHISTWDSQHLRVLESVTSPLAAATEIYQTNPDLQESLHCVEIAQEVMQLVELLADGTRIEHWVRLGQSTQVFINCDLMNARELTSCLDVNQDIDEKAIYAVPFGGTAYKVFHGNTDMLYNSKVDPQFHQKQQLKGNTHLSTTGA